MEKSGSEDSSIGEVSNPETNVRSKPMNRKFFILILCGLLAGAIAGFAQSSETAPPPPGLHDPVRELAHMTKDLKLSAEQQGQIKPILEQREAEMRTLHDGTTLSRKASMAQAKSIMDQ